MQTFVVLVRPSASIRVFVEGRDAPRNPSSMLGRTWGTKFTLVGVRVVESGADQMQSYWPRIAMLMVFMALPALAQQPTAPVGFSGATTSPAVTRPTGTEAKAATMPLTTKGTVTAKGRHKKKEVEKAPEPVQPPPPPPPPPTPEQLPPNPPQVSYLNGQLTIQSTNATMSSIFSAIKQQTGATIDVPPGAGNERVATRVGPGPANDVIASLLSGSSYDFVIVGSPDIPGGVRQVILSKKSGPGAGTNMASMIQRPAVAPQAVADDSSDDEEPEAEPEQANTPDGTVPVPLPQQSPGSAPPSSIAPNMPPTAVVPDNQQQQPQGNSGPQIKTPEQMLQELQRLQQQQQKQ